MPVVPTTPEEYDVWLTAPTEEALKLQKPLPDDMFGIMKAGNQIDQQRDPAFRCLVPPPDYSGFTDA
jgi:putative SOS response-associated peptidase YedK